MLLDAAKCQGNRVSELLRENQQGSTITTQTPPLTHEYTPTTTPTCMHARTHTHTHRLAIAKLGKMFVLLQKLLSFSRKT